MNWSVSTYFCTKHMYNQNLVFVSCTHRDLYLIYAPLVNQGCKVFMLHRSQRKNGEEKFFVQWSRRCRAVKTCRDSYFQISMSQHCSSDLGSPHTHLWASCSFLLLRADHQGPLEPSSTPSCSWGPAGAESCSQDRTGRWQHWVLASWPLGNSSEASSRLPLQLGGKQSYKGLSAIIRRRERQKREKIDVLSSLQQ